LDDKVVWDEAEEVEDASSQAAIGSSSATHGDEGSEELVDSGGLLGHSSKFPGPSLLRDWFEDDDGEIGSATTLGGVALHVAAAAAAGVQAPPIVDLPEFPEAHPAASEPVGREEAGSGPAGSKRWAQPASSEPAEKRKKLEPAARDLRCPRTKKVVKRRAITVAG
jgi:hypothetical protein